MAKVLVSNQAVMIKKKKLLQLNFCALQNPQVDTPTPKVKEFEYMAFGWWLGHKSRVLMVGLVSL